MSIIDCVVIDCNFNLEVIVVMTTGMPELLNTYMYLKILKNDFLNNF